MSLVGYECACVDRCACFDHIKADPVFAARIDRLSAAIQRFELAELHVGDEQIDALTKRLEALADEAGL